MRFIQDESEDCRQAIWDPSDSGGSSDMIQMEIPEFQILPVPVLGAVAVLVILRMRKNRPGSPAPAPAPRIHDGTDDRKQ